VPGSELGATDVARRTRQRTIVFDTSSLEAPLQSNRSEGGTPGYSVADVTKPEHDSCPHCDSVEISTRFERSESSGVPKWECHCTSCRFKWSEKP
jgi:DNA-directed RNA polymerase subunit M/transcription elongation factor TFIIS